MNSQCRGLNDNSVQKSVGAVSAETQLYDYHTMSQGLPGKYKQHAHDLVGPERTSVMRDRIDEVDIFSLLREPIKDYKVKSKGSPFSGMDIVELERFTKNQEQNFQRNVPFRQLV